METNRCITLKETIGMYFIVSKRDIINPIYYRYQPLDHKFGACKRKRDNQLYCSVLRSKKNKCKATEIFESGLNVYHRHTMGTLKSNNFRSNLKYPLLKLLFSITCLNSPSTTYTQIIRNRIYFASLITIAVYKFSQEGQQIRGKAVQTPLLRSTHQPAHPRDIAPHPIYHLSTAKVKATPRRSASPHAT